MKHLMHLVALAVLFTFLVAAEDGCAGEEVVLETPPPTAVEPTVAPAPPEEPALDNLGLELEYLVGAEPLLDEGMETIDDFTVWLEDVAIQYEQGVMFPDRTAGELALDRMKDIAGRVESLDPPPAFQESHDLMLAAHLELVVGMGLVIAGAEQIDPGLIDEGTEHVLEATRLMGLATEAMPES